jgi:hypothetical protein
MRYRSSGCARISLFLLLTYLNACTSWRVAGVPPQQAIEDSHYRKSVRVTTADHRTIEVSHPQLRQDTLVGQVNNRPIAIPLSEIRTLAVRRTDTGRTILLLVGLAAVTGAALLAAVCVDICKWT